MSTNEIKILLVDDSAVIRGGLTQILETDTDLKIVGSVQNGELALAAAKREEPDIIILDIEMPVMDGITALPKLQKISPKSKIIMFSAHTEKGADITMKALSLGAVECILKPKAGEARVGSEFQQNLIRLLRNLCGANENIAPVSKAPGSALAQTQASNDVALKNSSLDYTGKPSILAIGSSTGGPQALFETLKHLKGIDIPIVITQHMPATFTKILATHITQQTGIEAQEGEDGMGIENGKAYVAPGGYHMLLEKRDTGEIKIQLNDGAPENFCKPAVDPMLRSIIDIYGNKTLCLILTGMGQDGLNGAQLLAEQHGRVIAQDEATSVVWGMPGAVASAGICNEILPLQDIGPWVHKAIMGR